MTINSSKHPIRPLIESIIRTGALNIHLPRWVIFCVDLSLVFYAYLIMVFIFRDILKLQLNGSVGLRMGITMVVYAISARLFGIYRGTLRYSGFNELARLFGYVLFSAMTTWLLYLLYSQQIGILSVHPFWVFIHGAISFLLLFSFRIAVKYTYYFVVHIGGSGMRKRLLIFGSDPKSISIMQGMVLNERSSYRPVAMLDPVDILVGKSINGVKFVAYKENRELLLKLKQTTEADSILFTERQLSELKQSEIDLLLECGFKLFSIASHEEYGTKSKNKGVVYDINIEDLLNREVIKTNNAVVAEKHVNRAILVTGAAGSIGSEIAWQIAKFNPKQLIVLDQAESPLHELELKLRNAYPDLHLTVFIGDIRNSKRMNELFECFRPEVVYHAAAYKHVPMMERYPAESVRTNVMGTRILADLAVKYEARKFVMVSTDKAVNPTNVMGATKRIAEIYVQSLFLSLEYLTHKHRKRTRFITTRFGNVLGSNGSVVPLFKDQIAKGGPITLTHKDIIRYFMTIPEACRLVLEAGCMGKGGEIFVFDMGEPVRIYDLAVRMIRLAGLIPEKDIAIVETGLRPGEKLYEELLNDEELTLPTHHEKIMAAKVRAYDYEEVSTKVDQLIEEATAGHDFEVVRQMKSLVPEFKSKNSIYEELDL